jgi:hypothetical protein
VACFAAKAAGVWNTTMTSTLIKQIRSLLGEQCCCPSAEQFPPDITAVEIILVAQSS